MIAIYLISSEEYRRLPLIERSPPNTSRAEGKLTLTLSGGIYSSE
jgi:hypothetical protein